MDRTRISPNTTHFRTGLLWSERAHILAFKLAISTLQQARDILAKYPLPLKSLLHSSNVVTKYHHGKIHRTFMPYLEHSNHKFSSKLEPLLNVHTGMPQPPYMHYFVQGGHLYLSLLKENFILYKLFTQTWCYRQSIGSLISHSFIFHHNWHKY